MIKSFSHIYICLLHSYHTSICTENINRRKAQGYFNQCAHCTHQTAIIHIRWWIIKTQLHGLCTGLRERCLGLLSDQVGHLLTREADSTFKMVNIDFSISVCLFLFLSVSHSVMTNPPPLVTLAVAYAAFKWGGINPSNNMTAGWKWWCIQTLNDILCSILDQSVIWCIFEA